MVWIRIRSPVGVLLLSLVAGCAGGASSLVSPAAPVAASAGAAEPGRFGQERLRDPAEARNHYAPVISMLVPGYAIRFPQGGGPDLDRSPEHGFVWAVPFLVRRPNWRHAGAFSVAEYIETGRRTMSAVYRLRLASLIDDPAVLHLFVGGGAAYDLDEGFGSRAEMAWLVGRLGRGGGLILVAHEYSPSQSNHSLQLAFSFFVPYVFGH